MKGWGATGLLAFEGHFLWDSAARNMSASNNLSTFATVTAPGNGSQDGDVSILDSYGRTLWTEKAGNASAAVAPDSSFAAFSVNVPVPEIRLRDRTGKLLAYRSLSGTVVGITSDSKCVLLQMGTDLVGLNRELKEVWRLRNAHSPQLESQLIVQNLGSTVRASKMPVCR